MVGTLFAIGGAEAKLRRRTVLGAFVMAASASPLGPDCLGDGFVVADPR
jgi:hypothetical protein